MRRGLIVFCALLACCSHEATTPATGPEVFLQLGHSNTIQAMSFSPDGTLLASAGKDGTLKIWDVSAQRELRTLNRGVAIDCVGFSPDGQTLASGTEDGTVVLWEVSTGRVLHQLNAHSRSVKAVTFSADGQILATGSNDHTIKLWDPKNGTVLRTLGAHHGGITALAFSPDGHTLASGSVDKTISLWDSTTGNQLRVLSGHSERVTSLAFCRSGPVLASGSWDRSVRLWDFNAGRELRALNGHVDEVTSVACTSDGRTVAASGSSDHRINLWDTTSGRELPPLVGEPKTVESLAFSPGGRLLASAGETNSVTLWDMVTGQKWGALEGHAHFVKSVAFSADGRLLVSGSVDGVVNSWPIADGKDQQRTLHAHDGVITATLLTPSGKQIVSRASDGTIKLWDGDSGTLVRTLDVGKPAGGNCSIVVSPDGRLLAAGTMDHQIRLWSLTDGRELRTWAGHAGAVEAVAFSPDGRTLASGSADKKIKLWDVAGGQELRALTGHTSWISCVAFSPDGKTLASGGGDKTVRLWDLANGRESQTLHGHTAPVWSLAFSPKDAMLASSDGAAVIKLWDASGRELRTLRGHSDTVESVAFSPDGRLLASASGDSTVRLWDTASGTEQLWLIAFNDGSSLRITPQGYYDIHRTTSQTGAPDAEAFLNVRVGKEVSGIGAYRERFYRPDVVRLALNDQKLPDTLPTLASVKPAPDVALLDVPREIDSETLDLRLRIADRGGGIGDVRTLLNGTAVSDIKGRGLEVVEAAGGGSSRTIKVRLVPGNNEIQVIAFNDDGSVHSNPAVASVLARYSPTRKPQLYALVVGIQDFVNPSLNLKYSVADANAVAQIIQKKAAPLFETVHVETLTTPKTTSKEALTAAFARYQKIEPNDVFVFYVATHGTLESADLARREYFLIPSNFNIVSDAAIQHDALSEGELKRMIASIPATRKLLLLDTCHAGAMGDAMMVNTRDLAESGAVTVLAGAVGSTILSASASDQEALEGEDGHGLFTSVLLRGLDGRADVLKHGAVKTLDLAVYVDDEVPKVAMQHFKREQYPNTHNAGRSFEIVTSQ